MFNLIVAGSPEVFEHWPMFTHNEGFGSFPVYRMLESTSDEIRQRLTPLNEKALSIIESLPTLFMTENYTDWDMDGHPSFVDIRVGTISNVSIVKKEVVFSFQITQGIDRVSVTDKDIYRNVLGLGSFGLNRTHWGVKNEDLQSTLSVLGLNIESDFENFNSLPQIEQLDCYEVSNVKSFLEYVLALEHDESEEIFYRGHSDTSYELAPSLFRRTIKGNFRYLPNEASIVREALTARPLEFSDDKNMLDRLVRMQHYGLPTRLLDITSNPLIALYFSCSSVKFHPNGSEVDGHVIIFKTNRRNIKFFDSDTVSCIANLSMLSHFVKEGLDIKQEREEFNKTDACRKLVHYIKDEKPYFENMVNPSDLEKILFVKGRVSNERISSQSGAFLLFGNNAVFPELISNDALANTQDFKIEKVIIKNKGFILNELAKLNITEATVYQGMERTMKLIAEKFTIQD